MSSKNEHHLIELKNVKKEFDGTVVLENINLYVKDGEFVTFLGPSGCGKTTTLRMIAGFDIPTSGEILLNGEDITKVPPHKRPVNTVFQRYALFPHLDVYDNIAFGLKLKRVEEEVIDKKGNKVIKLRKLTNEEIDAKVTKALQIVDLEEFEWRDISTLSGGQQQRVAIARALAKKPDILLLDEPLSNLDTKLRVETRQEIRRIQKETGVTAIFVTHDQEEAMSISDEIVLMKDGAIQQISSPSDIYMNPVNKFVASFIGSPEMNFINLDCKDGMSVVDSLTIENLPKDKSKVVLGVRAEDFEGFLKMIKASGDSSYKYLQNVYTNQDVQHQNVSVALAVSDAILGSNGVCRVHGGGFAGTIQAFVKDEAVKEYKETLDKVFGQGACAVLKVRKYGGMKVM